MSLVHVGPVATTALLMLLSASSAAAPVSATLNYTCVFPLIEEQPLSVDITSEMPDSLAVGQPSGSFQIDGTAIVSAESWNGLDFVGSDTLSGQVDAHASVTGNGLSLPLVIPMEIAAQPMPDEQGAFSIVASGVTPSLTFTSDNQGAVEIRVGNLVLNLTPRDDNDNPTGLGDFQSECVPVTGEEALLHTITVSGDDAGSATFGVTGDAVLKGKANWPLVGELTVETSGSSVSGSMGLETSALSLDIPGLFKTFPLDAQATLEPVSSVSGELIDGELVLSLQARIRLADIRLKLFGVPIAIYNGEQCVSSQAMSLSAVTPPGQHFDVTTGGQVTGEYSVPAFENCGVMTGLVNRYLAGAGSSLSLQLAPL